MGTASFTIGKYARTRGSGPSTLASTDFRTSGAFSTTTTVANLEDAVGDVTVSVGEVVTIDADEAMRVAFGGVVATASTGHYIAAGGRFQGEVETSGFISIIDVA